MRQPQGHENEKRGSGRGAYAPTPPPFSAPREQSPAYGSRHHQGEKAGERVGMGVGGENVVLLETFHPPGQARIAWGYIDVEPRYFLTQRLRALQGGSSSRQLDGV